MSEIISRKSVITSFEADTKSLEKGAADSKKLVNGVRDVSDKTAEAVKKTTEETKKLTLESSKAGEAISDALGPVGGILVRVVSAILSTIQSLKGAAIAARAFGLALVATGIGAIVVVVGALAAAFLNTQRGADAITRALFPLKAIFLAVLSVVEDLGTRMVDAFKNPKQAFIDLGKIIKENLVNRLLSFKVVFEGIINLDLKQIGNGFIQGFTGVENVIEKIGSASKQANLFLDDAIKKGRQIADINIQLERLDVTRNLEITKLNNAIDEQYRIINSTQLPTAQRKKAYDEILQITQQQADVDLKAIKLKQERLAIEQNLNDEGRKQSKEINDLEAERLEIENSVNKRRRDLAEKLAAIYKEDARNRKKAEEDRIEAIKKSREIELKALTDISTGQLVALQRQLSNLKEALLDATIIDDQAAVESVKLAISKIENEILAFKVRAGNQESIEEYLGLSEKAKQSVEKNLDTFFKTLKDNLDAEEKLKKDKRDKELKEEEEIADERLKNIERIKNAATGALQSLSDLNQQQIDQVNQAIGIQAERVSRFEELAQTGSARQLIIEEERLAKMETIRSEALAKQRRLAQAQMLINQAITVSESVKAVAQAFGTPGPLGIVAGIAMSAALALSIASMASNIGGLFGSIPAFAKGKEVIAGPGTGTSDSIMARLSKGERVTDAATNMRVNQVARGVFPNRLLPDAVASYMATPEISAAMGNLAATTERGFRELLEEQRATKEALRSIRVSSSIRDGQFSQMVTTYERNQAWRRQ